MDHEIGYLAGQAATWHALAIIDRNEGNYAAAKEKFGKALKIDQEIGNRAGEAATWRQLYFIALKAGKKLQAVRLLAVSWHIFAAIGEAEAKNVLNNLDAIMEESEQRYEMMQTAWASYQRDAGATLLREAFGS